MPTLAATVPSRARAGVLRVPEGAPVPGSYEVQQARRWSAVPESLCRAVGPSEVTLWAELALWRRDDTGQVWPSRATIATRMGVSVRTVARGLDALERAGYLVRSARWCGGRRMSSVIVLHPAGDGRGRCAGDAPDTTRRVRASERAHKLHRPSRPPRLTPRAARADLVARRRATMNTLAWLERQLVSAVQPDVCQPIEPWRAYRYGVRPTPSTIGIEGHGCPTELENQIPSLSSNYPVSALTRPEADMDSTLRSTPTPLGDTDTSDLAPPSAKNENPPPTKPVTCRPSQVPVTAEEARMHSDRVQRERLTTGNECD